MRTIAMAAFRNTTGFKAGQSADGGLGIGRETAQTINAGMSALEPTMYSVRTASGFKGSNGARARGIGYARDTGNTLGSQLAGIEPTMVAIAFAQNARDEVRRMGGDGSLAGALAANPGMKQTTYLVKRAASGIDCLTPGHPQTHRVYGQGGAFPSICANTGPAGQNQQSALRLEYRNEEKEGERRGMKAEVRRLTPNECDLLMGFPKGYTAPMGAESARYSADGNSWAANCARFINKGIHRVDARLNGGERPFRYGTISSGIECHSLSVRDLGDRAVFFSEISPAPVAFLKGRYPSVPVLGDMTLIDYDPEKGCVHNRPYEGYVPPDKDVLGFDPYGTETPVEIPVGYGEIDLVSGGTPCQSFSVAGRRDGGAEGSGTRSSLAFQLPRIGQAVGARWLLWENVPGAFSSNGGRDFLWFAYRMMEAGYTLAWRTLDAQYVRTDTHPRAVPQRRRRIWLVGYRGDDWRVPCEVLFEPVGALGTEPPVRTVGVGCTERLPQTDGASRPSELEEFERFVASADARILALCEDSGVCESIGARRAELRSAERRGAAADGGDLFGALEKRHQGRGLKAGSLALRFPGASDIGDVGLANLCRWARSVSGGVSFCGTLFAKGREPAVDNLSPDLLANVGNAGFLSGGVCVTMKMPEWNAGLTEDDLSAMPPDLAELYDGDVCGLSDVLEDDPDCRYGLSWRACFGILNRAKKRAKQLPMELGYALVERIVGQAEFVKWVSLYGRDEVKREGQVSEREVAKNCLHAYVAPILDLEMVAAIDPKVPDGDDGGEAENDDVDGDGDEDGDGCGEEDR